MAEKKEKFYITTPMYHPSAKTAYRPLLHNGCLRLYRPIQTNAGQTMLCSLRERMNTVLKLNRRLPKRVLLPKSMLTKL